MANCVMCGIYFDEYEWERLSKVGVVILHSEKDNEYVVSAENKRGMFTDIGRISPADESTFKIAVAIADNYLNRVHLGEGEGGLK